MELARKSSNFVPNPNRHCCDHGGHNDPMDLQHDPWEEDEDQENVDLDSAEDLDDEDDEDSEPEEIVISKEDWDLEIEKDEESYL